MFRTWESRKEIYGTCLSYQNVMRGNRSFFTTRVYTSATIETTEIYIRKVSFFFFFFLFFSFFFPESVDIPTDLVSTWLSIFLNLLTVEKNRL